MAYTAKTSTGFCRCFFIENNRPKGACSAMFDKLLGVEDRFNTLEQLLSDPEVLQDRAACLKYSQEHAELGKVVEVFRTYKQTLAELEDGMELLKDKDPDIKSLAKDEVDTLTRAKEDLEDELKIEMVRPGILKIENNEYPSVFETVKEWRKTK